MAAVEPPVARPRPVYLNLTEIRLPLPAKVSILHRASGALLFFAGIPLLLWAVGASLASPESFAALKGVLASPIAKLAMLVLAWAYLHHLLAGVRHLLLDARIGVELPQARQSAAAVLAVSLFLTLLVGVRLW
jgi:succinate dehydrogenase / fumarate reductase, cytochrome b subunit